LLLGNPHSWAQLEDLLGLARTCYPEHNWEEVPTNFVTMAGLFQVRLAASCREVANWLRMCHIGEKRPSVLEAHSAYQFSYEDDRCLILVHTADCAALAASSTSLRETLVHLMRDHLLTSWRANHEAEDRCFVTGVCFGVDEWPSYLSAIRLMFSLFPLLGGAGLPPRAMLDEPLRAIEVLRADGGMGESTPDNAAETQPPQPDPTTDGDEEATLDRIPGDRDREIVRLWRHGWTCARIADRFILQTQSVKNMITSLRNAFGPEVVPYHRK